jgi:hypothetical protein
LQILFDAQVTVMPSEDRHERPQNKVCGIRV